MRILVTRLFITFNDYLCEFQLKWKKPFKIWARDTIIVFEIFFYLFIFCLVLFNRVVVSCKISLDSIIMLLQVEKER